MAPVAVTQFSNIDESPAWVIGLSVFGALSVVCAMALTVIVCGCGKKKEEEPPPTEEPPPAPEPPPPEPEPVPAEPAPAPPPEPSMKTSAEAKSMMKTQMSATKRMNAAEEFQLMSAVGGGGTVSCFDYLGLGSLVAL